MNLESIHISLHLSSLTKNDLLFYFCWYSIRRIWCILVKILSLFDTERYGNGGIVCGNYQSSPAQMWRGLSFFSKEYSGMNPEMNYA
jgi:hypothetical protein